MTGSFDRALAEVFAPSPFTALMGFDGPDALTAMAPFATGSARTSAGAQRGMPLDIFETKDALEVHADIPGVDKQNIKIETHQGNTLTISVDRSDAKEDKGGSEQDGSKWHRCERSRFFVKRSVRLPEDVDASRASAAYQDGVLRLTMPRVTKKETTKRIEIS